MNEKVIVPSDKGKNTKKKPDHEIQILLSELQYAREGITKVQENIGKSLVIFYTPLLIVTGYGLIETEKYDIIFTAIPFLLFIYISYISYVTLIQRGFEIYRCQLEEALEKYIESIPSTKYQRKFVPEYYYGGKWNLTAWVTIWFAIISIGGLSAIVLVFSLIRGMRYALDNWTWESFIFWLIAVIVTGIPSLVLLILMVVSKPQKIKELYFS